VSTLTGIVLRLADDGDIDPETGHGPEWGKAAPIALLIIVLLGIALVFLLKSMNTQLHKVPVSFDDAAGDSSAGQDTGRANPPAGTDVAVETPTSSPAVIPPDPGDAPPGR
jgi:hypothetical protein